MHKLGMIFILLVVLLAAPTLAQEASPWREIPAYDWLGNHQLEQRAFHFDGFCEDHFCQVTLETGGTVEMNRLAIEGLRAYQWMNDEAAAIELMANQQYLLQREPIPGHKGDWQVVMTPQDTFSANTIWSMTSRLPIHWEDWTTDEANPLVVPVVGGSMAILPDRHFVELAENAQCPQLLPDNQWNEWARGYTLTHAYWSKFTISATGETYYQPHCWYRGANGQYVTPIEIPLGMERFAEFAVPEAGTPVEWVAVGDSWDELGEPMSLTTENMPQPPEGVLDVVKAGWQTASVLPEGHWGISFSRLTPEGEGVPMMRPSYAYDYDVYPASTCAPAYTMQPDGRVVLVRLGMVDYEECTLPPQEQ